jgi:hypothetical protein
MANLSASPSQITSCDTSVGPTTVWVLASSFKGSCCWLHCNSSRDELQWQIDDRPSGGLKEVRLPVGKLNP